MANCTYIFAKVNYLPTLAYTCKQLINNIIIYSSNFMANERMM
jgi:hypothetical protein